MSKQTDLINKFMGKQGDPAYLYRTWEQLMPVIVKIAKEYNIFMQWYDGDCSIGISNRTVERSEIVSYGGFKPDEKNVRYAINDFLTKHYEWT